MLITPIYRAVLLCAVLLLLTGCFTAVAMPDATITVSTAVFASDATLTTPSATRVAVADTQHPLSIAALRDRSYPGSDFVTEEVLEPGANYNRYIVSYQSEGLKIYVLLTVPQGERPPTGFPVVIFNHGYIPPAEYRTTERYVAYVDAFARNGYIVVKSDYRGHGFSEGEAASVYGSPGYVVDVLNAAASARRYPDADPDRVGMWGHSMGGYITLRAMVAQQDIRAGVIWAGVVASYDEMFRSWFQPLRSVSRPGWRTEMVEQYGAPADNPAFWNALSANAYLTDLSGPVQLHHGTGDTTVPFEYTTLLDQQIRAAGRQVETFLYDGDDHNIAANRDDALTLSVVFFNRYVKDAYN